MLASMLPAWVPSDPLLLGAITLIVAVLFMNKGRWWIINALAQDEPVIVAAGVTIAAGSGGIAEFVGSGGQGAWFMLGSLIALSGVVIWWSDSLDVSGLIG